MTCKNSLFILVVLLGFTSCITTYNMDSIQVEILKPALLTLPDEIDTIAVFMRDQFQSDTISIKYLDVDNTKMITDSMLHYRQLSNKCVDALANFLEDKGYFLKVVNYRDSMNDLFTKSDSLIDYPGLFKKLRVDACVFLDYFQLDDRLTNDAGYYFTNAIINNFPEFKGSTQLESIGANLFWTIAFKGDTAKYVCKHPDELYYGNSVYPELFGNKLKHRLLLQNTAEYLGKSFGEKIVPSWLKVDRTYYRSNNTNMLKAEKYCLDDDWLKAAEIYKKETNNKNRNIAAKAKYNMALISEMEGKPDVAIDWLVRSFSSYKHRNEQHEFNCKQYIELLATRKKEIERLGKQIKNRENIVEN
jgi:hypothetical protein